MPRTRSERTGMAAVALVLIVGASFMLMTAGAGDTVVLGLQNASRNSYNNRTSYAAYGALQESLDKLNTNFAYACDDINNKVPLADDPDIRAGISIFNNYAGTTSITVADGNSVPAKMVYIKVAAEFKEFPGRFDTALNARAYIGLFVPDTLILGSNKVVLNTTTVDAAGVSTGGTWYPSLRSARIVCNAITPACINITATAPTVIKANLACGPVINAADAPAVVASSIVITPPASVNTGAPDNFVLKCLNYPARVARFRPYSNPKYASDDGAADDRIFTGDTTLGNGEYRNFSATNCTVSLSPGQYYVADSVTLTNANITIPGVSGGSPCMFYVGRNITITNSTVNWDNHPDGTNYAAQQWLGPRTMQFYFVGSGRPRTADNVLSVTDNSKISLHAAGKAMVVKMRDSEAWGGFKGFSFEATDSKLHYHRTSLTAPLPWASADNTRVASNLMFLTQLGVISPATFPYLLSSAVVTFNAYPAQPNPYSAWSTEGMADDEAEGADSVDDYGGGYGY